MDAVEINCVLDNSLRVDFPSEKQLAALASAWDDGANHQICFLNSLDAGNARRVSEYGSMIASADLVLPRSESFVQTIRQKAAKGSAMKRPISVAPRRQEYLSYFEPFEDDVPVFHAYQPLKTLSLVLSALELRHGSVFLIGGALPALQRAEQNIRSTFPGLRLVGRSIGDYSAVDEFSVMRALQKAAPDMIVAGSGLKGGELWVSRHMRFTKAGIFLYDASIIEVLSGRR